MAEKTINVATETTSQEIKNSVNNIYEKVDTEVATIVNAIGATGNTGGSTTAGTVMGKLNALLTSWTSTRAGYIDTINTNAARLTSTRATKIDNIGATGDTGGSTSAGTVMGKLNKIISDIASFVGNWTSTRAGYIDTIKTNTDRLTSTRAGYIDNIRSYTVTNNTASKTGVLSQKLAYVISLLENTTYGLSALKTSSSSSVIKSIQRGEIVIPANSSSATVAINSVNTNKAIILYGGSVYNYYIADSPHEWDSRLVLTNSTTITAYRATAVASYSATISYQVVEFY